MSELSASLCFSSPKTCSVYYYFVQSVKTHPPLLSISFLTRPFPCLLSRDTLNTPFFGDDGDEFAANGATPADFPYAPIPNQNSDTTYVWPLSGSEAYYSTLYTGEQLIAEWCGTRHVHFCLWLQADFSRRREVAFLMGAAKDQRSQDRIGRRGATALQSAHKTTFKAKSNQVRTMPSLSFPVPRSPTPPPCDTSGPFPPNECPNLYPSGVAYEGCYPSQSGWTTPTTPGGPTGKKSVRLRWYRVYTRLLATDLPS